MVLIEFGGNDATADSARHVPLEEFEANLEAMLERLRGVGAKAILLTFPPIIDAWHAWGQDPFFASIGGPDGVHLTAEGNRVVAETVFATLVFDLLK